LDLKKNGDNAAILYQLLIKTAKDNIDIYKIESVRKQVDDVSLFLMPHASLLCTHLL